MSDPPTRFAVAPESAAEVAVDDPAGPPPVLPPGADWDGILVLPGPARIDGRVRGEILAEDTIWIGETGVIEADLEVESVVVAGRVEGHIRARTRIELRAGAVVIGGITTPVLSLAEGAVVNGPCAAGDPWPKAESGAEKRPSTA